MVGSAGAVAAVFITDYIRARRKARDIIPALLRRQRALAINRRVGEEQAIALRMERPIMANSDPPFSIDVLMRQAESVADYLTDREQQGLDNIAHLMREAEELANTARSILVQAKQSSSMSPMQESPGVPLPMFANSLHHTHTEAVSVLSRLDQLIEAYLAGTLNEFGSLAESPALQAPR